MQMPFEATRSYAYRAARYELLPVVQERTKAFGETPFLLRDVWRPLLAERYSPEQLATSVPRTRAEGADTMRTLLGWYIPTLAEQLKVLENCGDGLFRNIPLDEEIAEVDAIATDVSTDAQTDIGIIYAFTFPSIKTDGRFPIKVGLTRDRPAEERVNDQCRTSCCFEHPILLKSWSVQRVAAVEKAIHKMLEARGWKRHAPGTEWFDTTLEEVESIMNFAQLNARP